MAPKIIFEDNEILVLDKPSGMVTNVSETSAAGTLQEWVHENYSQNFEGGDGSDFYTRSGLVHRLDKETSGIVIFAKTREAFENLQAQFKSRGVEKEYVALVFGEFEEGAVEIDAPIARNPKSRTKMAVVEGGKGAVTRIERVNIMGAGDSKMTLVKAFPKTGRTHQIRVHLAAFGHPIIGDDLYAGQRRSISSREVFGRLMLHANKITFTHPKTGKRVSFESEIPHDF